MSEVRSGARILSLLEYFARRDEPASLTQVTEDSGMPKSSTHNLLKTLENRGYVVRTEAGAYQMNEIFRQHGFGWGGSEIVRLTSIAKNYMDNLTRDLGETISLSQLTRDGQVKTLMQTLSSQSVRYIGDRDRLLPAFCTATGRILLAGVPEEYMVAVLRRYPMQPYTPHTITDESRIIALVHEARQNGYAISEEEFDLGGTGVAAAIRDA